MTSRLPASGKKGTSSEIAKESEDSPNWSRGREAQPRAAVIDSQSVKTIALKVTDTNAADSQTDDELLAFVFF